MGKNVIAVVTLNYKKIQKNKTNKVKDGEEGEADRKQGKTRWTFTL